MNRRELLCSLLTLPSARMLKTGGMDQAPPNLIGRAGTGLPAEVTAQTSPLKQSAPLVSMFDGQIFEYLIFSLTLGQLSRYRTLMSQFAIAASGMFRGPD